MNFGDNLNERINVVFASREKDDGGFSQIGAGEVFDGVPAGVFANANFMDDGGGAYSSAKIEFNIRWSHKLWSLIENGLVGTVTYNNTQYAILQAQNISNRVGIKLICEGVLQGEIEGDDG